MSRNFPSESIEGTGDAGVCTTVGISAGSGDLCRAKSRILSAMPAC